MHNTERQGTSILRVERGHFNDITVDVATISASSALLFTIFRLDIVVAVGRYAYFPGALAPL